MKIDLSKYKVQVLNSLNAKVTIIYEKKIDLMATLAFDELNRLIQGNKQTTERNAFQKNIHTLK